MWETLVDAGFPAEKVIEVPPHIPIADRVTGDLRNNDRDYVLYAGSLFPHKGVQFLLRASQLVDKNHQILVVGDGFYRDGLEHLVAELGLAERVRFLGHVPPDGMKYEYMRSKIAVVPSACPETFRLVGPEAMSYACPVVAFESGGVSSWLQDCRNGFLVKPKDIQGLADKLEILLQNEDLSSETGKWARQYVATEFTPQRHLQNLVRVYEEAILQYERA